MASRLLHACLVAASLAAAGAAFAQQPAAPLQGQAAQAAPQPEPSPSHLAAARELIGVTNVLGPVDELLPAFGEQIRKQNVTRPELTKDLDTVINGLAPELLLQRQQVLNSVARTYCKWLTEPEIKELTTFYRTPVGAKFNKLQPDLVDDVVADVQRWTQDASEYVMVRTRAEMQKRGHQMQ